MTPDHFVKVFDILDNGFRNWTFSASGLIFVAFGAALVLFPTIVKKVGIPFMDFRPRSNAVVGYALVAFGVLSTLVFFSATYSPYQRHKTLAQEGRCRLVEGRVERFVPSDPAHPEESFTVTGVTFRYSDLVGTDGFNNSSSRGGPIRADQYVRICYDPAGNLILRLEIRDFTGAVKNDAQVLPPFPSVDDRFANGPGVQLPASLQLLSSLVWALGMLDVFAIWSLFLPYLRRFIRIKSAALPFLAIPDDLQPDTKIKLGNSMIYWDRNAHTIWLRPRGFNLIQFPATIAKLNVDPDEPMIFSGEIQLSPVMPVIAALMLWSFYQAISWLSASAKAPLSMAPFLVLGVAVIVVGFALVMTLRQRMAVLVLDALRDIRHMGGDPTPRGV